MIDRGFTELDLLGMLERAVAIPACPRAGGGIVTRFGGVPWNVVVEPDPEAELLVLVTAFATR